MDVISVYEYSKLICLWKTRSTMLKTKKKLTLGDNVTVLLFLPSFCADLLLTPIPYGQSGRYVFTSFSVYWVDFKYGMNITKRTIIIKTQKAMASEIE